MDYKTEIIGDNTVVWYEQDGYRISFIDPSPGNTEYERYVEWVAAGNTPEVIEAG